ncbi:MAG: BrnA antitoxin family protein [Deltaproteobacteria bacterium]|nr:BrnA antitoxin family protein [Deltaproteobacteria bacterium]
MNKTPDPKKLRRIHGPRLSRRELSDAKVRITTYLDRHVVEILRQLAIESGGKYQTILNHVLRDYLLGEKQGLLARLARLENAVFRAKAA